MNLAELAEGGGRGEEERGGECKDIGHDIHQPQGAELAAAREGEAGERRHFFKDTGNE